MMLLFSIKLLKLKIVWLARIIGIHLFRDGTIETICNFDRCEISNKLLLETIRETLTRTLKSAPPPYFLFEGSPHF